MENLEIVGSMGVGAPKDQNKSVSVDLSNNSFESTNQISINPQFVSFKTSHVNNLDEIVEYAVKNNLCPQAYVQAPTVVENWENEKELNGVIFYKRFLYSTPLDKGVSLQDKYGEDANDKFIIAVHRRDQKGRNGNPIPKFGLLPSATYYLPWMDNKSSGLRNDFEYIIQPQRKFFIDLDGGLFDKEEDYSLYGITKDYYITNYNNEEKLMAIMSKLIDEYQRIMGPVNLERDVVLWSSSGHKPDGSYKFSYHLIFPNCFMSYDDCKMLRDLMVEHMEPVLKYKMIDMKVYLPRQQLRMPFNEKLGSGRPKFLADLIYHGRLIKHQLELKPLDENHMRQMIFLESIIGFRHSSNIVDKSLDPSIYAHIKSQPNKLNLTPNTNSSNYKSFEMTEGDHDEIVEFLLRQTWINQFNIAPYSGRGFVHLSRNSKCKENCVIHHKCHGSNGSRILISTEGHFRLHCMGSVNPSLPLIDQRDLYLGRLSSATEVIETVSTLATTNLENTKDTPNHVLLRSPSRHLFIQNTNNLLTGILQGVALPDDKPPNTLLHCVPPLGNVNNHLHSVLSQIAADPKYFIKSNPEEEEENENISNPPLSNNDDADETANHLKPELSLNFQPGILRQQSGNFVIDAEYLNGIVRYFYLPQKYILKCSLDNVKDGYTYQVNADGIMYADETRSKLDLDFLKNYKKLVWRVVHRGDNKLLEQEVLDGMDHLSTKRAKIDKDYYYLSGARTVYLNFVGCCLKEIIRRNRLPEDNIKDKWLNWMINNFVPGDPASDIDYEQMWEDANPWIWSSQQFLKWIKEDSHDSVAYFEKYPHLYIIETRFNQLKLRINTKDQPWLKYVSHNNDKILPIDLTLFKTLLIKAGMDMRKTFTSIQSLVKARKTDVLFICQRIAAGQELTGRLERQFDQVSLFDVKGTKYEQFLPKDATDTMVSTEQIAMADMALEELEKWVSGASDDKPEVLFYKRFGDRQHINPNTWLICQLESLPKLLKMKYKVPQVLVLDEATSIFYQLSSTTIKNKEMVEGVQKVLEVLIKESENVLCLCANLDSRTVKTMHQLRPNQDIHFHEYTKKIGNRLNAEYYVCKNTIMTDMTEMVLNGKNLFIVCTHQTEAEELEIYFNDLGKRVLCIHSDCSVEARNTLNDVNETWPNYYLVIVTNTVTTSVSFHKKHFHAIAVLGYNDTINFRTISQMIGRVRNPIDKLLMVHLKINNYQNIDVRTKAICRKIKNEVNSLTKAVKEVEKNLPTHTHRGVSASDLHSMDLHNLKHTIHIKDGCLNEQIDEMHWFTKVHLLNKHEDNVSKLYMMELFLEWIDEQEIPLTIKNYSHFHPTVVQSLKDSKTIRKNYKNKVEAEAPVQRKEQIQILKEKFQRGTATKEEKITYKKSKIINRFKPECSPDAATRHYYETHSDIIENFHDHLTGNINILYQRDCKRFISLYHSTFSVHKGFAIQNFCELIGVPNILNSRDVPPEVVNCFSVDMEKLLYRLHPINGKFFPIYYDTRFLARQPNEPDKPGVQISDKCLEVATLCSGAFGLHSKTIKRVATANNIFVSSLMKYFEAEVFTGKNYDISFNSQRVYFTPYIICIRKSYSGVAQQLKTYEEMAKGYQGPVQEIKNPVLSIISQSEIEQLKEINKVKVGNPPVPDLQLYPPPVPDLQLYPPPPPQHESDLNPNGLPVNSTDTREQSCEVTPDNTHNISLDYESLFKETKSLPPGQSQNNVKSQSQSQLNVQINPLELLVDYTLYKHGCIDPQHLVNRIRQVGYYNAFRSLNIKSKPITDAIDKHLKTLKISGLNRKSLGINPDNRFPNVRTKYDRP